MNEQQPYEKHLAERFEQLPLPDVEPNWQQMKLRLDKEMPRGGGYWRWITGFGILLLMLGGTWFFIRQKDPGSLARVGTGTPQEATKHVSPYNPSISRSSEKEIENKDEVTLTLKNSSDKSTDQLKEPKTKSIEENLHKNADNKTFEIADRKKAETGDVTIYKSGTDQPRKKLNSKAKNGLGVKAGGVIAAEQLFTEQKYAEEGKKPQGPGPHKHSYSTTDPSVKNATVDPTLQNLIKDLDVDKLIGDSIRKNYSTLFPETVLENQNSEKISGKTRTAKSKAIESVENRTLAVGFSLPLGFPLGDQKPGAYNINAKPNTISDFVPVPHLQYHINNKVYLQTELQFMNPQFIQPVLLYQNQTAGPGSTAIHYNSVYARKLYYFNIPVGIHYSPFSHFYLGTGLQFSSLVSGVALHEETRSVIGSGRNDLVSQRYAKFRNDTISSRIDNSEFRLMLDANYYWKQFTVGLRYNQALSNYVSFRLNNASPLFQDKNKSLQFYLRYNLWEDYKRKKK